MFRARTDKALLVSTSSHLFLQIPVAARLYAHVHVRILIRLVLFLELNPVQTQQALQKGERLNGLPP